MPIQKNIYILIISAFLLSIFTSFLIIKNYDKYEISTDEIENHRIIKGDIPDIWIDGQTIKNDLEVGKSYFESGKEIFRSYLPPRLIALYSYIFDYDLFEDWDKRIISSDNSKIFYLIIQSLLYYFSIFIFFKKLIKYFNPKICFFIILFLSLEPTIFFFHSTFHTESIFFTMQILMLTLLMDDIDKISRSILIGVLLGIMFLQKLVAIYYIIPIFIYYIIKLKYKAIIPFLFVLIFYVSIIGLNGYGNYKRAGIFYFMPPSSKITLHLYFPNIIISKGENISPSEAKKIVDTKKIEWINKNNINLKNEKDRIMYYNYLQDFSIQTLIKYPLTSFKYIAWRTLQTGILNPIYVLEFFYHENAKKPEYYLNSNYKKINLPLRIIYSAVLYTIVIIGFFYSVRKMSIANNLLLVLSSAYMLGLLGWANNSRYMVPILIYFSIYFGHGVICISEKLKKRET